MLFTIARPIWANGAEQLIQRFRQQHDPQYMLLGAHFTIAFGVDMDFDTYLTHVRAATAHAVTIQFVLRHAMPYSLGAGPNHVFLVPDEGCSQIARLHATVYTGVLAQYQRLDMPFVPHITVAVSESAQQARALSSDWNVREFALPGRIDTLTIGRLSEQGFRELATWPLKSVS